MANRHTTPERRPLSGSIASSFLLIAVSVFIILTVTLISSPAWFTSIKAPYLPLFIYIVLLALLCLSFSLSGPQKPGYVALTALVLALPCASVAVSIASLRHTLPVSLFWAMLVIWIVIALAFVIRDAQGWNGLLLLLATTSIISGVICAFGETRRYPFAKAALGKLRGIHIVLDVRTITSLLFVLFLVVTGIIRAWGASRPKVSGVLVRQLPNPDGTSGLFSSSVAAIIGAVNVAIRFGYSIFNLLWISAAWFVLYLYAAGREVYLLLRAIFTKSTLLRICRISLAFILTAGIIIIADVILKPAIDYLRADGWRAGGESLGTVLVHSIIIFAMVTLLAMIIHPRHPRKIALDYAVYGLTYVSLLMLLSSAVVYLLRQRGILRVVGFNQPGLFSSILFLLFLSLIGVHLARSSRRASTEEQAEVPVVRAWLELNKEVTILALLGICVVVTLCVAWFVASALAPENAGLASARPHSDSRVPSEDQKVNKQGVSEERAVSTLPQQPISIGVTPTAEDPIPLPPRNDRSMVSRIEEREEMNQSTQTQRELLRTESFRSPPAPSATRENKSMDQPRVPQSPVAFVSIVVDPDDAIISLDGEEIGQAWGLRHGITTHEGTHILTASKDGFMPESRILRLAAGKNEEVRVSMVLIEGRSATRSITPRRDIDDTERISGSSLPVNTDRSLLRHVRGSSIVILYSTAKYEDARALQIRLERLGARVTLQMASPRERGMRANGVYYADGHLEAARAVQEIARDMTAGKLFRWDSRKELITIYLLD